MPNANKVLRELDRLLDKIQPPPKPDPFVLWLLGVIILGGLIAIWALTR